MVNGIVISCDRDLKIHQVQYNSFGETLPLKQGMALGDVCNPDDQEKLSEFRNIIERHSASFNWEVNMMIGNELVPLKFSGGRLGSQYLLFGVETDNDLPYLCEELMKINSEQANYLRELARERYTVTNQSHESKEVYEDFMVMNNEMAALQRQLSAKNAELERINAEKNKLLGVAAHDLRSPLVNIIYQMRFIRLDTHQLSARQHDLLDRMDKTANYMLQMINDLLDVSSIEEGKVSLRSSLNDLSAIIRNTVEINQTMAEQKEIIVIVDVPDDAVYVNCDAEKIHQVIANLFTNAVKYSPRGTKIAVTLDVKSNEAIVTVSDEGMGIDEQELEKLFKPFERKDEKDAAGDKSVGLGLFIVKSIIEAHGGEIRVKSHPGKGSKFSFALPVS